MNGERFPILGALGGALILLVVICFAFLVACEAMDNDAVPPQPTSIEIDVDRAKPRPPLKTQPKKQAPAPRSKS